MPRYNMLLMLLFIFIVVFISQSQSKASLSPQSGWGHYKEIDIINPHENMQIKFHLIIGNGVDNSSNYTIYIPPGYSKNMLFDVRFGSTNKPSTAYMLPQWLESSSPTEAYYWINTTSYNFSKIYLYVGNSGAGLYSDGDETFIFFDDFSGSSINSSKWTNLGVNTHYNVSGGYLNMWRDWGSCCSGGCYYDGLETIKKFDLPIIVEWCFKQDPYSSSSGCSYTGPTVNYNESIEVIPSTSTTTSGLNVRIGSATHRDSVGFPTGMNRIVAYMKTDGVSINASWLTNELSYTDIPTYTSGRSIIISGDTDSSTHIDKVDYLFVRRYLSDSINVTFGEWKNAMPCINITDASPHNNSKGVDIKPDCSVHISSMENFSVYFYEDTNGYWVLKKSYDNVSNGTYHFTYDTASDYSIQYSWKVSVNNTYRNVTNIYYFTTRSIKPSDIPKQSTGNQQQTIQHENNTIVYENNTEFPLLWFTIVSFVAPAVSTSIVLILYNHISNRKRWNKLK